LDDVEPVAHLAIAAQQHRRRRADTVVERRDRDLRELHVIHPKLCPVGDDDELARLGVDPTKAVRASEGERAGLGLKQVLIGRVELLLEVPAERLDAVEERLERGDAAPCIARLRGLRRGAAGRDRQKE